jgi:predicted TIM-barrel fold metal-dependent hydrolase
MVRPNPVQRRNLDHPDNDVFWGAAADLGLAVATHEGTGVWMQEYGADRFTSRLAQHAVSHVFEAMQAVYCFTAGGILERFPTLRVGFLEAGGTWLTPWLYRLDEHAEQLRDVPSETSRITERPSEYFRRQCWISCEPDEPNIGGFFEYVGRDRVMWASDFPHPDAKYPGLVAFATRAIADTAIDDDAVERYIGANARDLYRL